MNKWSRLLAGVLIVAAIIASPMITGVTAGDMDVKFVGEQYSPTDAMFRYCQPQSVFMYIDGPDGIYGVQHNAGKPDFDEVISTDRDDYRMEHPFRGVVQLGDDFYGFVFDGEPIEQEDDASSTTDAETSEETPVQVEMKKAPAFDRLYFDVNHNGALTDDEPIEATDVSAYSESYVNCSFPRVELKITSAGVEFDYAFTFSVYANASTNYSYANASMTTAAYREGTVEIDGEAIRIVLVDYNSNGRFDDETSVLDVQYPNDYIYEQAGDRLFINPSSADVTNPYDLTASDSQHPIASLVNYKGTLYDLTVSPSGDTLELTPSDVEVGYVSNPNPGFIATVYGDQGVLKIQPDESGRAPLPPGEWKLLAYTIDWTDLTPEEAAEVEAPAQTSGSLLAALQSALGAAVTQSVAPNMPRITTVSARGIRSEDAVTVVAGETAEMSFGPPYRAEVEIQYSQGDGTVSLGMAIVGSQGESCSNLLVNGSRPGKPSFTITTPDGVEAETGDFEYG